MTFQSRKNRRTTAPNAAGEATAVSRAVAADAVSTGVGYRRVRFLAIAFLCAAALVPLFLWLTAIAGGAEPRLIATSGSTQSSLKWRSSGQTSASSNVVARIGMPRRDIFVRPAQAVGAVPPANNPLDDPFNDRGTAPPRLLEAQQPAVESQPAPVIERQPPVVAQPAPVVKPQAPTATETSPTIVLPRADQYAAGNGLFKPEECPKLTDLKPISAITNRISASPGELPKECYFDESVIPASNREWMQTTFMWKSSGMCHKPLYFEQVALERYGHSTGRWSQPFVNGAHFFATVPLLPYKMGINPPGECQYALGYYRPGSCAPYIVPPIPLSARGAALEAGTVTGAILLLP